MKMVSISPTASFYAEYRNPDGRTHGAWRKRIFPVDVPSVVGSEVARGVKMGGGNGRQIIPVAYEGLWYLPSSMDAEQLDLRHGTGAYDSNRKYKSPFNEWERGWLHLQGKADRKVGVEVDEASAQRAHERLALIAQRRFLFVDGKFHVSPGRLAWIAASTPKGFTIQPAVVLPPRPDYRVEYFPYSGSICPVVGMSGIGNRSEVGTCFDVARFDEAIAFAEACNRASGSRMGVIDEALARQTDVAEGTPCLSDDRVECAAEMGREIRGLVAAVFDISQLGPETIEAWLSFAEATEGVDPEGVMDAAERFSAHISVETRQRAGLSTLVAKVGRRIDIMQARRRFDPAFAPLAAGLLR